MRNLKSDRERIVITGIGPIGSVGVGKDDFWEGLVNKKVNIEQERYYLDGELWEEFYLHKLDYFDLHSFGIDKDKLNEVKNWKEGEEIPDFNYLLAGIKLALDDGGLYFPYDDVGLVLTHENLGLMQFGYKVSNIAYDMLIDRRKDELSRKEFFQKLYKSFIKSGYDIQSFVNLFHISKIFGIRNYSLFINNACASGLYALEAAAEIIKAGLARKVVVAASDYPEVYKYIWFKELGIYSSDGLIRPFCYDSNGLVFGEGGVGILLEDFESAQERNANVYAEFLGAGFDLEGWKITLPQIGSKSYHRAIIMGLERSGVSQEEIDLLCTHGVGSKVIDYYEAKAIMDVFGSDSRYPLITAFKPLVGHNLGGSALLETAIMLLCLKNSFILPTLNYENPSKDYNFSLLKEPIKKEIDIAMKICCAFAGFNASAVFRRC